MDFPGQLRRRAAEFMTKIRPHLALGVPYVRAAAMQRWMLALAQNWRTCSYADEQNRAVEMSLVALTEVMQAVGEHGVRLAPGTAYHTVKAWLSCPKGLGCKYGVDTPQPSSYTPPRVPECMTDPTYVPLEHVTQTFARIMGEECQFEFRTAADFVGVFLTSHLPADIILMPRRDAVTH